MCYSIQFNIDVVACIRLLLILLCIILWVIFSCMNELCPGGKISGMRVISHVGGSGGMLPQENLTPREYLSISEAL